MPQYVHNIFCSESKIKSIQVCMVCGFYLMVVILTDWNNGIYKFGVPQT